MKERLLTVKEVSEILGISENKVSELVQRNEIPAYKIGGIYLRFKREQIEKLKGKLRDTFTKLQESEKSQRDEYTLSQKIKDFFYFYDFYILCSLIILILLILIIKG